jgi:hypothetical protein
VAGNHIFSLLFLKSFKLVRDKYFVSYFFTKISNCRLYYKIAHSDEYPELYYHILYRQIDYGPRQAVVPTLLNTSICQLLYYNNEC